MVALPTTKRTSTTNSTAKWDQTFPNEIESEKNSATFVHRFINITAAFILDKRGLLEDKCFKTRNIEKLQMPTFCKEHPISSRLKEKIDALKEAISNKYLLEFAVVFYRKPDEEDVIEVYSFRLMYGSEGEIRLSIDTGLGSDAYSQNLTTATFTDLTTTKKYFVDTIRKLHRCIKHLDSFPEETDASFRIAFTEHAPKDYMPKGFDESDKFYEITPEVTKDQFGILCGKHHKLQLLAASQCWKANCDLNKTMNSSFNQSICEPVAKTSKAQPSKGAEKKAERTGRRLPYGKSETLRSSGNSSAS